MKSISNAIDEFLALNELGKTDAKNLNKLIGLLEDGKVATERAVQALYADAKNPDGSFKSFIMRIRAAIKVTADNQKDKRLKERLESIKIITHQKTSSMPGCISIKAHSEPTGHLPAANRQYPDENYVQSEASSVDGKPLRKGESKLFLSYSNENARLAHDLKDMLEQQSKGTENPVRIWSMLELLPNQSFIEQIREKLNECDLGLACLSQAFLNSQFIAEEEVPFLLNHNKIILVGLDSRWDGRSKTPSEFFDLVKKGFNENIPYWKKNLSKLLGIHVYHLRDTECGAFWGQCVKKTPQEQFVDGLIGDIRKVIKQKKEREEKQTEELKKNWEVGDRRYLPRNYVDTEVKALLIQSQTEASSETQKRHHEQDDKEPSKPTRELVPDMLNWAANGKEPVYAILGDYGMGKTFSCRIFAQRLDEAHKKTASLPISLYMDLRKVQTFVKDKGIERLPRLDEMIDMMLKSHGAEADPKRFIEDARHGRVLPIFDGLDEKLVYYTRDMQYQFLNELMRVFPFETTRDKSKIKVVISCRTHHFESIAQQSVFLQGLYRDDSMRGDFRAMEILPLSDGKMRQLLEKRLGRDATFQVWEYIDRQEYLAALGRRPLLLSKLPDMLPSIQSMQSEGIPVNAAVFYKALIDDVLARDNPKHVLKNRHKHRLLLDLALYFWEKGEQSMNIDNLNDWYQAWLRRDPDMFAQYQTEGSEQLEKDLRNSTLLLRFGEKEFGFTHSSMQEYLLARKLLSEWGQNGYSLAKPVSRLTEKFIGEALVLLEDGERRKLREQLAVYAARPEKTAHSPHQDALLLCVIHSAAEAGRPFEAFDAIHVFGVNFSGERIRGLRARKLTLNRCEMPLCRWQESNIDNLELNETNINQSVWEECRVEQAAGNAQGLTCVNTVGRIEGLCKNGGGRIYPLPEKAPVPPPPYAENNVTWGHNYEINALSFSPDGRLLASASSDDTVRIWSAEGECLRVLEGHSDGVHSVDFSPDGRLLASASSDNTVRIWSAEGECLRVLEGHSDGVHSVGFSPDGRLLASASSDDTVRIWSAEGECLRVLEGHSDWVHSVGFSPDGRLLASASSDDTVRIWSAEGECLRVLEGHSDSVWSVGFSPDGRLLASASSDDTVRIWSAEGECLRVLEGHSDSINSVGFSPDGRLLASASSDDTVRIWSAEGECLRVLEGHFHWVHSVGFSPDGRLLASASYDHTVRIWSAEGECLRVLEGHSDWVHSVGFSPDGRLLASASSDNTVRIWSAEGECLHVLEGHFLSVNSVGYSPDGRLLASASYDHTVRIWSAEGECLRVLEGHSGGVWSVGFSPDGRRLASASSVNMVRIWSAEGECLRVLEGHSDGVRSVGFSPDGRLLASASYDHTVRIWSAEGECLRVLEGHSDSVMSVGFSPDGRRLASASFDKTVRIWSAEGECLRVLEGHSGGVMSVGFSPDGRLLASASDDNTVRIWSAEGECLRVLEGHSDSVMCVGFSPDGRLLASGSHDGTHIIWSVDQGLPLRIMSAQIDGQWWSVEIDENRRYTRMLGTELAWQRVWLRHKDGVASLDAFDGFRLVPSRHCLKNDAKTHLNRP